MIKFIVDDLANYTGDLLDYSEQIVYLPKKIFVDDKEIITTPEYTEEFYESIKDGHIVHQAFFEKDEYENILSEMIKESDVNNYIYIVPDTFGAFESDFDTLLNVFNTKYKNKVTVIRSRQFSAGLHLLLKTVLSTINESTTLEEIISLIVKVDSKINSFILTDTKSFFHNFMDEVEDGTYKLVYIEDGKVSVSSLNEDKDYCEAFKETIEKVASHLNKRQFEDHVGFVFIKEHDTKELDISYFMSLLNNKKDFKLYKRSQSCASLDRYEGIDYSYYNI